MERAKAHSEEMVGINGLMQICQVGGLLIQVMKKLSLKI